MTLKNLFILVLTPLLFQSCVKDANIPVPKDTPKPVLGCFLSPDEEEIVVTLSISEPTFQQFVVNQQYEIQNAVITISNGSITRQLQNDGSGAGRFVLDAEEMPVIAGNRYTVTVQTPSAYNTSAAYTVPAINAVAVDSLKIDITESSSDMVISRTYKIRTFWTDLAGQVNNYRLYISSLRITSNGDTIEMPVSYYDTQVFSDKGKDGRVFSETVEDYYHEYIGFPHQEDRIIGYNAYLFSIDTEYYTYYKSLDNYAGEDPFSEPTLVYSNIPGAYGIICSYRVFKQFKAL